MNPIDQSLKNGFETFPFLEKMMAPYKQDTTKKIAAIQKALGKYFCRDMIEEVMQHSKECNYPELENPNGITFRELCSKPPLDGFVIALGDMAPAKSCISRVGDFIFGVYSKERPNIGIQDWDFRINMLETSVLCEDKLLWMLETPLMISDLCYIQIEIKSGGAYKLVYGMLSNDVRHRLVGAGQYLYKHLFPGKECFSYSGYLHFSKL